MTWKHYLIFGLIVIVLLAITFIGFGLYHYERIKQELSLTKQRSEALQVQIDIRNRIIERDKVIIENAKKQIEKIRNVNNSADITTLLNELYKSSGNTQTGQNRKAGQTTSPTGANPANTNGNTIRP